MFKQVRSKSATIEWVVKVAQGVQNLALLKYVNTDGHFEYVKQFFTVLKAGIAWVNTLDKYVSTGQTAQMRIAKDLQCKHLARLGTCIMVYIDACKALTELRSSAGEELSSSPLLGLTESAVFGETATQWDPFFDSVGLRAVSLKDQVDKAVGNFVQLAQGLQAGSENHWRADADPGASMQDLKNLAKTTLKKIDGQTLKDGLTSSDKAGVYLGSSIL